MRGEAPLLEMVSCLNKVLVRWRPKKKDKIFVFSIEEVFKDLS